MKLTTFFPLLGLTGMLAAASAFAAPLIYDFTGIETAGNVGHAGDTVSGEITYNFNAPGSQTYGTIGNATAGYAAVEYDYGAGVPVVVADVSLEGITYVSPSATSEVSYSPGNYVIQTTTADYSSYLVVDATASMSDGSFNASNGLAHGRLLSPTTYLAFSVLTMKSAVPAPVGSSLFGLGIIGLLALKRRGTTT